MGWHSERDEKEKVTPEIAEAQQFVAGERGIASFSTSFLRRGLRVTSRAT
jgi:hypothetical protein